MKYQRTMPEEKEQKVFKKVSEGIHKFQITDIHSEDENVITVKCEVVDDADAGINIFHRVDNNPNSQFFWLTKLFLKCIDEPHNGDVTIDTSNFIGRRFTGKVVHTTKDGKTYANIRELIYKDEPQLSKLTASPTQVKDPSEIKWDE
jgi:hypothetical protein